MTAPSTTPATKPEPVRLFGIIITAVLAVLGGLGITFADNQQVTLVLGILVLVVGAIKAALDEYVRGQVIPAADVQTYVNDQRRLVPGPAAGQAAVNEAAGLPATDTSPLDILDGVGRHSADDTDDGD